MNHRERELAAIRHEIPDRIPVDAIAVENTGAVAAQLGIPESEVRSHLGLDGRLVGIGYDAPAGAASLGPGLNEWGAAPGEVYGSNQEYPLAGVQSVAEVEGFAWPDPARYGYATAAQQVASHGGEYAVRGPYWQPLFCRVCSMVGMETAMVWIVSQPALFEAALEAVFQRTLALCGEYLRQCGSHLDILCLGDDFASQRGLLISPELWRRHLKPRYARLFELGKAAGKPVWFHSCGDITAVLPDLIDIGMDLWETVQLHTLPLSPGELKREYGRHLAFFGAVNTQRLPFCSAGEVAEEVRRCVEVRGEAGGYICGPDHHIKPDVPAENAIALFRAVREFRREGYTSELGDETG